MKKYICVEDYIDRNGAYLVSTPTTLKQVCEDLKAMPPADVIPISYIEDWFRRRYHTSEPALIADWRADNA